MASPEAQYAASPQVLSRTHTAAIIRASAKEALGSAVVVWILGGVALSLAGGFAGDMVPSPPPGFGGAELPGGVPARLAHACWRAARGNIFALSFAVFFAHSLWVGFHGGEARLGRRMGRALRMVRKHWFSMIVLNAIGAWLTVLVMGLMLDFSLSRLLWQWVCNSLLGAVRDVGAANFPRLGAWLDWFGNNHSKLAFWGLYLAGICDDLGVPNLKTLSRWAWRRYQQGKLARRQNVAADAGRS